MPSSRPNPIVAIERERAFKLDAADHFHLGTMLDRLQSCVWVHVTDTDDAMALMTLPGLGTTDPDACRRLWGEAREGRAVESPASRADR